MKTFFLVLFILTLSVTAATEENVVTKTEISDPSKLFDKACLFYSQKKYYNALKLFEIVVSNEPENYKAISYLGDLQLITGKLDKAEETFHVASEISQSPFREFYRLGQLHFLKKNATESIKYFQQAYKLNPKLHISQFQIGLVYYKISRNKEKTIHHWTLFRKLAPNDPQGPEIDKALAILMRKDFKFPKDTDDNSACKIPLPDCRSSSPCCNGISGGGQPGEGTENRPFSVPSGENNRVPYKKADPAKEKEHNKAEDIIELDDL